MNAEDARAAHLIDQAVAGISEKLDEFVEEVAEMLPTLGYEESIGRLNVFLATYARRKPDAVAAVAGLAAVAIVRLARDGQTQNEEGHSESC